jgi:hypothetical protein
LKVTDSHHAVTFKKYVSDRREKTYEPRDGWTNRAEPSRMAEHTDGHHAWEVLDRALRGIGLPGRPGSRWTSRSPLVVKLRFTVNRRSLIKYEVWRW